MENQFGGKAIKLLKPYINFTPLILDPANGTVKNKDGKGLVFGEDYVLVEDNTDSVLVRIYDSNNVLIHEFKWQP